MVPGRIIRMLAVMNMKQLGLKQTFVRHVSHEIRFDNCDGELHLVFLCELLNLGVDRH